MRAETKVKKKRGWSKTKNRETNEMRSDWEEEGNIDPAILRNIESLVRSKCSQAYDAWVTEEDK